MSFSADSSLLVSSSHDGLCRIWDAETGSCMKTLLSPANPPISFARFTPNSKYVLTASMGDDECCLKLWNYESGKAEKEIGAGETREANIDQPFELEQGLLQRQSSGKGTMPLISQYGKIIFII